MTVAQIQSNIQRGSNTINTTQKRLNEVQQEYDSITKQADELQRQINQSNSSQSGCNGTSIFSGMMGQCGSQSLYGNNCDSKYGSCMDQMMLDQMQERQNQLEQEKNSLETELETAEKQYESDKKRVSTEIKRTTVNYGNGGQ